MIAQQLKKPVLRSKTYLRASGFLDLRGAGNDGRYIDVRVDWGGDEATPGTFEVKNTEFEWEAVGNLSVSNLANDLIVAGPRFKSGIFAVHIERGPNHPHVEFEAWVYPLQWNEGSQGLVEEPASDFSPVRGTDYARTTEQPQEYRRSQPDSDTGVHRLTLKLEPSRDYELWVNIRHPDKLDVWHPRDPIARPGSRADGSDQG